MTRQKEKNIWNFFDFLEGDKVVWTIVLFLILMSVVCLFSSTSRLLVGEMTRLDIVADQLKIVVLGIFTIIILYRIKDMRWLKMLAQSGLLISLVLLLLLVSQIDTSFIKSIELNGARRILSIKGLQLHVFEVVKVAMVLYLAWAQDAIANGNIKRPGDKKWQRMVYIYIPFLLTVALVLTGSASSALFIGAILFMTILFGGEDIKRLLALAAICVAMMLACAGLYSLTKNSKTTLFPRIGTAISRVFEDKDWEGMVIAAKTGSKEYYEALDEIRQPLGAKIAIKEGKVLGKGPGQSTQRYVVPDMSEDYMFSFIIEEYGWLGAIPIIFLYVSLLARGTLIVKSCPNDKFAKITIAGLCLLISGQAFLHMMVNVDIGPMTGQTLPLISHGNSAFLCFCIAFGFILSISRIAAKKIGKAEDSADSLSAQNNDSYYRDIQEEAEQYDKL